MRSCKGARGRPIMPVRREAATNAERSAAYDPVRHGGSASARDGRITRPDATGAEALLGPELTELSADGLHDDPQEASPEHPGSPVFSRRFGRSAERHG